MSTLVDDDLKAEAFALFFVALGATVRSLDTDGADSEWFLSQFQSRIEKLLGSYPSSRGPLLATYVSHLIEATHNPTIS